MQMRKLKLIFAENDAHYAYQLSYQPFKILTRAVWGGSLDGPAPSYYADNNNVDNMKPCHTIQKSWNFYLWWALPYGDLNLDLSENSIEMVS